MSSLPLTDTETEEIRKIKHRLDSDEKVEIVAKQSRIHPGGSATSPDIIFITNKRIIIKNLPFLVLVKIVNLSHMIRLHQ